MRREASLWHACQLRDLRSYLEIGGIPSRALLELSHLGFTPFVTDASDRNKGLWPKVFLNLADFGRFFAMEFDAVPNAYGPIAFQIHPNALRRAVDVAICLRSAGASDFDRSSESLESPDDVERLFRASASAPLFQRMEVRFGEELRRAFEPRYPEATTVEFSLAIEDEVVPIDDVIAIWIDPIHSAELDLPRAVKELVTGHGPVAFSRSITGDRHAILQDLVRVLEGEAPPLLRLLARRHDVDARTRQWATRIDARGLQWQFERFARYLVDGTLATLPDDGAGVSTEEVRQRTAL